MLSLSLSCSIPFIPFKKKKAERVKIGYTEVGYASWYGPRFHGERTSSGDIFNMHSLSCAHRTLPFGTILLVTNLENGKSVKVVVNDRGPFVKGRIIDLSYGAARALGMIEKGVVKVRIRVIGFDKRYRRYWVQLAAFLSRKRAENFARKVTRRFGKPKVIREFTGGVFYYKVRIGPFYSRKKARKIASKLSSMGYTTVITCD